MRYNFPFANGFALLIVTNSALASAQMSAPFTAPASGLQPWPLSSPLANAKAAVPTDVVRGATVYGSDGRTIGFVQGRDDQQALVGRAKGAVAVPITAFGKTRGGLVVELTKAQFDRLSAGSLGTH